MTETLQQALSKWHALEERAATADAKAKALKLEAAAMEFELFNRMEHEETGSIKNDRLGVNFVRAETIYGQIQDRSEFVKWAEENDPTLLEQKERKALVSELVRTRMDNGEKLPPGVGVNIKQYISKRSA